MHRLQNLDTRIAQVSPPRVFAIVLLTVFIAESAIMWALAVLPGRPESQFTLALVDATALVSVLCPVLWFLVVRPLRTLIAHRGMLLTITFEAQEAERARLAGELHDGLGQQHTAVLLSIGEVLRSSTLDDAKAAARNTQRLAADAHESARCMARGLSPSVLNDFGLGAALERVCEDVASASGLEITREFDIGERRFHAMLEIAVFRVIQEALNNAVRHADASRITVRISADARVLRGEIQDDGRGMSPRDAGLASGVGRGGLGLGSMRERVLLHGGEFTVTTQESKGTTLAFEVPLSAESVRT